MDKKDVFIKFWFFFDSVLNFYPYVKSIIPGYKKGVSASTIAGYNIGISKYINDEDEFQATLTAYKFLTSKEILMEGLKENIIVPAVFSLYKEKEVCPWEDCKIFEELQPIGRPANITDNFDKYSKQFTNYIYEFIYGNKTASEVLLKVDDITKIYYISTNIDDSYIGLITIIVISLISILMIISFIFPLMEKFSPFFKFIPLDLWFISILGSVLLLSIIYTELGIITSLKCHLRIILFCYGLTFNYIPVLYKLIINFTNFPGMDSFLVQISKHKRIFFLFFISIDTLLCIQLIIRPYNIEKIIIPEGKNFQQCKLNNTFQQIIIKIMVIYKGIIICFIILFVFMEWNINVTRSDIKFNISSIYIDVLSLIILSILNHSNIDNYIWNYYIRTSIFIIISLSNYFFLYGYKLLFINLKKKNTNSNIKKTVFNNFEKDSDMYKSSYISKSCFIQGQAVLSYSMDMQTQNTNEDNKNNDINNNNNVTSDFKSNSNLFSRIMNYHNQNIVENDGNDRNENNRNTFSNEFSTSL